MLCPVYAIKEIFYSLAGEGAQSGRPMVFCRFSGCNLWKGREEERPTAKCRFCDTDFLGTDGPGGGNYSPDELVARIAEVWNQGSGNAEKGRALVFTGGEPALQLDALLVEKARAAGFFTAIETNGTLPLPPGLDWICVSPKAGTGLAVRGGSELKLVFPQEGVDPENYLNLDFGFFFIQPLDGGDREKNLALAAQYCLGHPQWRLGLQIHKLLGLP